MFGDKEGAGNICCAVPEKKMVGKGTGRHSSIKKEAPSCEAGGHTRQ
jgi:hypothetical protein